MSDIDPQDLIDRLDDEDAELVATIIDDRDFVKRERNQARKERDKLRAERHRLQQEAEQWAQEARTHAATVREIYQLCTGATGEPGDWHGAEPVREIIDERDRLRSSLTAIFRHFIMSADHMAGIAADALVAAEKRRHTDNCPRCGAELPAEGGDVALCLCPACGCRVCEGGV